MLIYFLGLGNMGLNLALNMKAKGHQVRAWNRSQPRRQAASIAGLEVYAELAELFANRAERIVVWLMVEAGDAVGDVIKSIQPYLKSGDIVVDGANSHFEDTVARAEQLTELGVSLLDCGVSGGTAAAATGPCLMVGGKRESYDALLGLFNDIAAAQGVIYCGSTGSGHYVKMVHNAIEYGMMQAIAEGLNLLNQAKPELDLAQLTAVWQNGSVIAGNLNKFVGQALAGDAELKSVPAQVGSLGTARWAAVEALRQGVPFAAITTAIATRLQTLEHNNYLPKLLQAMRQQFGGHDTRTSV